MIHISSNPDLFVSKLTISFDNGYSITVTYSRNQESVAIISRGRSKIPVNLTKLFKGHSALSDAQTALAYHINSNGE